MLDALGHLVGEREQKINSTLIFRFKDWEPLYIRSGANSIKWNYLLNTQTTPTLGGEVVQVLSCAIGPITIEGMAGGFQTTEQVNTSLQPGWSGFTPVDEMTHIVQWFLRWMHGAGTLRNKQEKRNESAIHFEYPARGWDFWIQPTALDGLDIDSTQTTVPWSITAEIVNDPALDYLVTDTMNMFTDSLTSRTALQKVIGDGQAFAVNPFVNPQLGEYSLTDLATRLGDNFQALVAAWIGGDFPEYGISAIADPGAQTGVTNPYDVYNPVLGGEYIGEEPKTDYGGQYISSTGGSTGAGGQSGTPGDTTNVDKWILMFLDAISAPHTQENLCFMKVWGEAEGGSYHNTAKYNFLNHSYEGQVGATRAPGLEQFASYDTLEHGVQGLVEFLSKPTYAPILSKLRAGNVIGDPAVRDALTGVDGSPGWNASSDYGPVLFARAQTCVQSSLKTALPSSVQGKMTAFMSAAEANEGNWHYSQARPIKVNVDPGREVVHSDCSGYCIQVYYAAKLGGANVPDPGGGNFGGSGSTYTMRAQNWPRVTDGQYQVGDLAFYNNPDHVIICKVGGTASSSVWSSFGSESGPHEVPLNYDNSRFDDYIVRPMAA